MQENIRAARQARIAAQAAESSIDLNEVNHTASAIIDACTKDNITVTHLRQSLRSSPLSLQAGRTCIFNFSQTPMQAETICLYLIDRVLAPDATSDVRLHLIYLINDILHNW